MWQSFEVEGWRPFPGGVILGDSAYPCREWLIPVFRGDVVGARQRFNDAHCKTRVIIEQSFGVVKNRFPTLRTGLRLADPVRAAKVARVPFILHNVCLNFNDNVADFEHDEQDDEDDEEEVVTAPETSVAINERRRNELLRFFQ